MRILRPDIIRRCGSEGRYNSHRFNSLVLHHRRKALAAVREVAEGPLAEEYAIAAISALTQCRDTGFFKDAQQAKRLGEDPNWEGLRGREDFKRLLDVPSK
jgi:hypothetical protein